MTPCFAEETKTGVAVQTIKETEVRKEPTEEAPSYGVLPVGTVLTLRGQREGEFLAIRVELEDGELEGWIKRDTINRDALEDEDEPEGRPVKKKRRRVVDPDDEDERDLRPKKRRVPKDEGLLIKRDTSFFYGLQGGPLLAIMMDSGGNSYLGPGFTIGANGGLFLTENLPLSLEVSYSFLSGSSNGAAAPTGIGGTGSGTGSTPTLPVATGTTTTTSISFGFLDVALTGEYLIDQFELIGTVQYSYGIGVSNLPTTIQIGTAADLSSLWVGGGAGYRFHMGEVTDLVIRAKYGVSFLRSPVGFQTVGISAYFDFKG